jgi:hypothetical protein
MKMMYETKRDAFIGGYESVIDDGVYSLKASLGTQKAVNAYYHSKKHAYLSGISNAKCTNYDKARTAFISSKDESEAVDAIESLVDAAKAFYLAAKREARYVAHISSLSANDAAWLAAVAKELWKVAERAAIACKA